MALEEEDAIFLGLFMSFYSYGAPIRFIRSLCDTLNLRYSCRPIYRHLRPIRQACEESEVEGAYGSRLGDWMVVSGNGGNGNS